MELVQKVAQSRVLVGSGSFLREVGRKELGHGEAAHPLGDQRLGHLLVQDDELLVFGVLEVVFLPQRGPELLDALGEGGLLLDDDGWRTAS